MPDWVLEPFESVGPVRLRSTPDEVRAAVDEVPREFAKATSASQSEAYEGMHAHYDANGTLEMMEAFAPTSVVYAGIELLDPDTAATLSRLKAIGLRPRDDQEGGLWFQEHGFALYAPQGRTEGVSAFRRDYETDE